MLLPQPFTPTSATRSPCVEFQGEILEDVVGAEVLRQMGCDKQCHSDAIIPGVRVVAGTFDAVLYEGIMLLTKHESPAVNTDNRTSSLRQSQTPVSSVRYLIGKTLNKYEVLDHIGHGGMSEVYRGQQAKLDRMVAIKVLHPFLADEEGFVVRFEREAKIVATLRHPNIVQVYDFDHDEELDIYFMVMEYIDGPTLKNRLEESPLSPEETARVGAAIADALDYAHQRSMVHRDIKPANIMFLDEHQPVLTDFGIAKMLTLSGLTASGAMVGTPAYMAPEIGLGNPGTASSDIYSLSVVLYQAVAGCLPFTR